MVGISPVNLAFTAAEALALQLIATQGPQREIVWQMTDATGSSNEYLRSQCTIEEDHNDDLVITEHPVEQGASIADHAYKRPASLRVRVAWADANATLQTKYKVLLFLQEQRKLLTIQTGKRRYVNMLLRSVAVRTDSLAENALFADLNLQQVLIAVTQVVTLPPKENHAAPQTTAPTLDRGALLTRPGTSFNAADFAL